MTVRLKMEELKCLLNLAPLPEEGGFYAEVYRSAEKIGRAGLPARFPGDRCFCTDIYYLLPGDQKSLLHRIKGEELWHFLMGDPFTLVEIAPDGAVTKTVMGGDLASGQKMIHAVKPGAWFGCLPHEGSDYSLVSCTVAPGFELEDFEIGRRDDLLRLFPHAREEIFKLTK